MLLLYNIFSPFFYNYSSTHFDNISLVCIRYYTTLCHTNKFIYSFKFIINLNIKIDTHTHPFISICVYANIHLIFLIHCRFHPTVYLYARSGMNNRSPLYFAEPNTCGDWNIGQHEQREGKGIQYLM